MNSDNGRPRKCCAPGTYECQIPMPIIRRVRYIDYCIADIVAALNAANIETVASCCGHGEIDAIISRACHDKDAQAIQTRNRNQREKLLTALIHAHVPLTNNHAERMIRPMVITRKISGGSRSVKGAAIHAVNMSIMQTLALQGKNIFAEIASLLQAGNPRYALGNS